MSDYIGRYPVVMISPADSSLITEGSEDRRRFMNKIISQYNTEYLEAVLKYNKALQQRNKLLKDFNPWLRDDKLTNSAGKLYSIRIPVLK